MLPGFVSILPVVLGGIRKDVNCYNWSAEIVPFSKIREIIS